MVKRKSLLAKILEITACILTFFTHWIIFYFVIINACKTNKEAARLSLALPEEFSLLENLKYVLTYRKYAIISAFWNSFKVTLWTMIIIVAVASMASFVLQRRKSSVICQTSDKLIVACMTVPASVIPTYYCLTLLHVAKCERALPLRGTFLFSLRPTTSARHGRSQWQKSVFPELLKRAFHNRNFLLQIYILIRYIS